MAVGHGGTRARMIKQLESQFRGVCIDTGLLLYRYRSAHTGTEAAGIDTELLLYRYRGS